MLRMRRVTDQGFVTLVQFVRAGDGATLTTRMVAETHGWSDASTAKVLKGLQRAGLLQSTRGLCGGYSLSCDPRQTSIAQIVEAFEGPIGLTDCAVAEHVSCDSHETCALSAAWPLINQAVVNVLSTITLHDLVSSATDPGAHATGSGLAVLSLSAGPS
ncbi:MAG: Rrf2 family transcriptional regulator [Deltaproteobacteria bacterium]|nr:MAG: Rrf2 family transcriptional regulator [Deltaproteobacteria bacterium]